MQGAGVAGRARDDLKEDVARNLDVDDTSLPRRQAQLNQSYNENVTARSRHDG